MGFLTKTATQRIGFTVTWGLGHIGELPTWLYCLKIFLYYCSFEPCKITKSACRQQFNW